MCNLYTMRAGEAEIRSYFQTSQGWRDVLTTTGTNFPEEIYKGYPGLVVAEGELRLMKWGFPLEAKGKKGQPLKPTAVNNARDDKLDSWMWRWSFEERRCLIPATAYAEAEGEAGRMTRTWISAGDQPIFACAGIWMDSPLWGQVYSMVTSDPDDRTIAIHDRAPVMLRQEDWHLWTHGTPEVAKSLLGPYPGPITINRTEELWVKR